MKILPVFLLFCCCLFFSQTTTDSTELISYEDQVIIRANFDTNIEDFIVDNESQNYRQVLSVNSKTRTSLGIDYQFISASISFTPSFFPGNNEDDLKGKSTSTDIKFQVFQGNFMQQFRYKNTMGFYLNNTVDFVPDWQKGRDPYLQFPNFRIQTFGGSTAFFLNKEFSIKSILFQKKWQTTSKGSLVPSLDYDLTDLTDDSEKAKSRERQYNFSANISYYYNWVLTPKINVAPFLSLGGGGKFSKFKDDNIKDLQSYFTYQYSGGLQVGYNVKQLFYGGRMNFSSYNYTDDSSGNIRNNNFFGLLFIGYRFAPPKIVQKFYDKIHKKIPAL